MARTRLSPAEAREILRRHAERLKAADALGHAQGWTIRTASFAKGEAILPNPSWDGRLGLVVQGYVAVHTDQRGDDRPLMVLTPGHTFGPKASSGSRRGDAALKALVRSEVWFLVRASPTAPIEAPRTRHRATVDWRRIRRAVAALVLLVALLLTVSIPSARSAVAALPMAIGEWCGQRGNYVCAEQAWSVAAGIAPSDARPRLALGVLHFVQGNLREAERAFESANSLAPDSSEALNNLGVIYLRLGDYELAAQTLRQALALDPGSSAIEQNLGLCLLSLGAAGEALDRYQSVLSLGSAGPNTLTNMAIGYLQIGEPMKAEEAALQALEYGHSSAAYTVLGVVALESRQPEEALGLLRQAQELGAGGGQVDYYLGRTYLALGQAEEAEAAFGRALAATNDSTVRDEIARQMTGLEQTEQEAGR